MDTPTPDSPAQQPRLRRFGLPEYLNFLFGLATCASLLLAYYWHSQSVDERIPTYQSQTRAILVSRSSRSLAAPSELQVLYKGRKLDADINAIVVYIWNAGKQPIKADEVLDPLLIDLQQDCEILDSRILKVSRPVIKFGMGEVSASAKNRLPVNFSILEQNDGAAVQIIYAGQPFGDVTVKGTVVGAGQLKPAGFEPTFWYTHAGLVLFLGQIVALCGGVAAGLALTSLFPARRLWISGAFFVFFVLGSIFFKYVAATSTYRSAVPSSIAVGLD